MHKKYCFSLMVAILAVALVISILPLNHLFAQKQLYQDFMGNYPSKLRKIKPGYQKAVYLTGYSMSILKKREQIYQLIKDTELNSIVFNVKDDSGYIDYNTHVNLFREIGAARDLYDIDEVIKEMDDRNIYSIARMVLFKDSILPKARPDLSILDLRTGDPIYLEGSYWTDVSNEELQDNIIKLVIELADKGVNEIQFDYIRTPARGNISQAKYSDPHLTEDKVGAIVNFLLKVREATKYKAVKISADVFGFVLIVENDQGIGQKIEKMAPYLDYLYPMPYPSHYSDFFLGYANPEEHPYEVVKYSLERGLERLDGSECTVIPWIQAFGLSINYTHNEILLQIKAAEDMGINGFSFWNAANNYTIVEDALRTRM